MTLKEVMSQLKKWGTEQACKIYKKHGAPGEMFGVSFANLKILLKKIKVDHDLAIQLWQTKNVDARTLALMIADPEKLNEKASEDWLKEIDYYMYNYYFADLIAKTPFAKKKMEKWMKMKKEYYRHAGYMIMCSLLKNGAKFSDKELEERLKIIEEEIHSSANRAKRPMNSVVISIGIQSPKFEKLAIETAKRIGTVEVDYGDTSCKTSEAISYIKKTIARKGYAQK